MASDTIEDAASTQSAGPLASPNKSLPFVRPADVYQRMEEERERERRSLESGRPGADNSGFGSGEQGVPETHPPGATQARPMHSSMVEDTRTGLPLNPSGGLAPVAERQSEYGMEGFLASYGTEGHSAEPHYTTQEQVKYGEPPKSVQPASFDGIRRFSTSPQLPDLGRMSGFGEDLFSSSSLSPASGLRSPVSDSMQLPTSDRNVPDSGESSAAAGGAPSQSATVGAPQNVAAGSATHADLGPKEEASQHVSRSGVGADAELSLHQGETQPAASVSEQQTPAADPAREPASIAHQPATLATRPSLPGGWVTETPSTPGGIASPLASPTQETPDNAIVAESQGARETDTQPEVPSLNLSSSRQSELEREDVATSANTAKDTVSMSPHPASPHAIPPLRTSSPALSKRSGMSSQLMTAEVPDRDASPSPRIQAGESNSPIPTSAATERSEIPFTAPLNPRRESLDSGPSTQHGPSPPSGPTEPALDASGHSEAKDSDMLSEEIMKSLSPLPDNVQGSTAAYQAAAADPMRESSYLGDVYDDYWAATEDNAEPDTEKAVQDLPPLPAEAPEEKLATPTQAPGSSNPPSPSRARPALQSENTFGARGLEGRFSWDAAPDTTSPVTPSAPATDHLVEQKASGSNADNAAPTTTKFAVELEGSQPSLSSEEAKSAEDVRAEAAPEFHPAGMLEPTAASDGRIQSPSPLSSLSDRHDNAKRLSLAEEKIAVQASSYPVSPSSPPLEQHPAFAQSQQPRQADTSNAPSAQNIVGFRNIMEMPTPVERIKGFNETRWQFSMVETGLDDWLKAMTSQHPEHASAVQSYPGLQQDGQAAAQAGLGGRVPVHIHMPHIQHQVGTKSKELLMAAGKAGKGLFSKGRNKLRGTGDKGF